ncbi:hypothetical protein AJ79_09495 [Helicocarpus griseus UAMH5409]|uniref:Mid2 domain-containing protein n=1 Tax=Helicocarpus griseus UAMH5409 TaxID=1447875 RepID=A0A2B7WJE2_9EURO|nr:hypothetical protein AJ79_09495 [Helicocarpus griseus UAMH5409]
MSIRRKETDFPSRTSSPSSTVSNTAESAANSQELLTGAKARIGVGVTVGVILLAALLWFLYGALKKRREKKGDVPTIYMPVDAEAPKDGDCQTVPCQQQQQQGNRYKHA